MRSIHAKCATAGLTTVLALIGGCAGSPRPDSRTAREHDLLGKFVWVMPPEIHEEFDLLPDGTLRWLRWNTHLAARGGSGIEVRGTGRWQRIRTSGHDSGLQLDFDPTKIVGGPLTFGLTHPVRLTVRRYNGHTYLLRPGDLAFFATHGPMAEFCLHRRDAPLEVYESYFLPGHEPTTSNR